MAPSASAEAPPVGALQVRFDEKVPILTLPEGLDLEAARAWLAAEIPAQRDVLSGRTARLDLGRRTLHLLELRRLLHFLRETWDLEITAVYALPEAVHRFAERELRLKLFLHDPGQPLLDDAEPPATLGPLADAEVDAAGVDLAAPDDLRLDDVSVELPPADPAPTALDGITLPHDLLPEDLVTEPPPALPEPTHTLPDRRTLTIHRTLRSGTVVRFDGDVFVFGDVNPGAQVVASGNLVVLGALKGMAWAGATGDDGAVIMAHLLRPTQLRISRKIATVPEAAPGVDFHPETASIVDGQIAIHPYQGRVRGK